VPVSAAGRVLLIASPDRLLRHRLVADATADNRDVTVDMTLTTPNCPSAQELPIMVENAVSSVAGVGPVTVNIVWEPPWDQSRMSEEARATLNMW